MKVPQLRFRGFEDEWEENMVSDLVEERTFQSPKSEEYPLMAFIANQGVAPKGERFDRESLVTDATNKLYKQTELGDFIYSSNNLETGSIGLNKYGKATISPVYSIFKMKERVDSDFVGRLFTRKLFINEMVKWRQGVIYGQWKIHESDFLKIKVRNPNFPEQQKIGTLLSQIDSLIQAKTKKLESLKSVKNSLLQKCFPKDGEKVPEMRFEGFSGEWEEKKLGEVADLFDYGLNASAKEFDGSNKYLRITDIDDETRIFQSFDLTSPNCDLRYCSSSLLCEQDIVFARTGASVGKTFLYNSSDGTVYFAGFLIRARIKEEYDRTFIFQNTLSEKYNKYIQITSQRSGQPGVNAEEYKEFSFRIPTLVEQQKIGQFFSKYDSLISLHQKEIDNLKTIKRSLLQKMFV